MTLVLTVDYEVFGNGSGSVEACVVAPTRRILQIAETHGAPVTLFVEALEFEAMRSAGEEGTAGLLRDWIEVRRQLQGAVDRGHDVQLHLHPQWSTARYESGTWRLDLSRWRLGDRSPVEIRELVGRGRRFLEEVVCPVRTGYRPMAFRAGGWCIQPSSEVVRILESEGLRVDSSVAPGLYQADSGRWYDYREAPSDRAYWPVSDDVVRPCPNGRLLEVPITVGSFSPRTSVRQWLSTRTRASRGFPSGCEGEYESPGGVWGKIKAGISRIATAHRSMLDFCRLPAEALLEISEVWRASRVGAAGTDVPVVAIGHCKNFGRDAARQLDRFLRVWASQPDRDFGTLDTWIEMADRIEDWPSYG